MTPALRTLGTWGRRGDRVRVRINAKRDRVEVLYRDNEGVDRLRIFSNTKEGKAEALAWGQTFHEERARRLAGPAVIAPITMRALWREFTSSPAWMDLREDTRPNYRDRWRLWIRFMGDDAIAGDTRLRDIDKFIVRMREVPTEKGKPRSLNQIRQVLNVVRTVYNWGQSRELLSRNDFALFRWKTPKDAPVIEPDEYTLPECYRILAQLSAQDAKRWRANVAILLAAASGQRSNAIEHLRWRDVDLARGIITWPAKYQKQGKPLERPISPDLRAALFTAWYWREHMAMVLPKRRATSKASPSQLALADWVLFAEQDRSQPVSYQSLHAMLLEAERRAKVVHKPYRALHGFRRMVVGEVGERTGDLMLGLELVGDTDVKMLKSYDRRRNKRVQKAAHALAAEPSPNRVSGPKTEKAPEDSDAVNQRESESYNA